MPMLARGQGGGAIAAHFHVHVELECKGGGGGGAVTDLERRSALMYTCSCILL